MTSAYLPNFLETDLANAVNAVRETTPLVQCVTNTVVQNFTANLLLAAGAAPAMADFPSETELFAAIATATLINVGTMSDKLVKGAPLTAEAAQKAGTPWVLDPVAVGVLPARTELAHELLQYRPSAVRGNASEIAALAGLGAGGRGVDATDSVGSAAAAAAKLARETGAVVAISGERDLIVWEADGELRGVWLTSGHALLPRVIGTGCGLGALTAAYIGANPHGNATEIAASVLAAHAILGAAGQRAAESAKHPGSFAVAFLDALDALTPAEIAEYIEVDDADLAEVA
ncbi:MAG: hydroxyethylthiazole kinase [Microbacteriaceae bacterium]|nr:hydroxyethylthiazole kinase [Microbacteriaceae bacterium]